MLADQLGSAIALLAFAPYPGHVSARTTRLFWFGLAVLGFVFWAFFVVIQQEWTNLRAWAGFALGVYILYWRLSLELGDESKSDTDE